MRRSTTPPGDEAHIRRSGFPTLSLFPTDQIWLFPAGTDPQCCSAALGGGDSERQGLIFVGHSGAGKSTAVSLLKRRRSRRRFCATIATSCAAGTPAGVCTAPWSHGEFSDVSPASAPLRALLFLQQAPHNGLEPLTNRKEIWRRLLGATVKPLTTAAWWQKELSVIERLVSDVPCFTMHFDQAGKSCRR